MKQTRTFKLLYRCYNEDEEQASQVIQLPFWGNSARDKETILARCKMEINHNSNPYQILEYVKGIGYQYVQ